MKMYIIVRGIGYIKPGIKYMSDNLYKPSCLLTLLPFLLVLL